MPEEPDSGPSRYREPWAPRGRIVVRWARRRGLPIALAVGFVVGADQSLLRTHRAPECLTCLASFDETEWSLRLPGCDAQVRFGLVRTLRAESPAADWVAPTHEHVAQVSATSVVRGVLAASDEDRAESPFPDCLPGAFIVQLEAEPSFGEFLRDAVARGDADPADLADAVEVFNDIERGPLTDDGPPDPRILAVTNELWAEWQGRDPADADLWGERD